MTKNAPQDVATPITDPSQIVRRPPLPYRIAARALHPGARSVTSQPSGQRQQDQLSEHRNILLVSFRRDGSPVPTPVWFASAGATLYARSEADAAKVKRICRNGHVLVAPCDGRGRPLGPAQDALARVLANDETVAAETLLAARYGITRRAIERLFFRGRKFAYLEIRLMADAASEHARVRQHSADRIGDKTEQRLPGHSRR